MSTKTLMAAIVAILLASTLAITAIPESDAAGDDVTTEYSNIGLFFQEVKNSNYTFEPEGRVTVTWSPSSACVATSHGSDYPCKFDGENKPGSDGNDPQRVQYPNAQYQLFGSAETVDTDVVIKNVDFVFEPGDFTLCTGSGWGGIGTADTVRNAEFQFQNTGSVTFVDCTFDKVIVSSFSSQETTTIQDCDFKNIYDAYALKDIRSPNATITGCSFDNCSGGIYFAGEGLKGSITIDGNTFTDMDQYASKGKENSRGLIQFSASGDYGESTVTIENNSYSGDSPIIRQLNQTITPSIIDVEEVKSENPNMNTSNMFTGDSEEIAERVYIDVNNGDDSNDGSLANPVKTFAKAMTLVKDKGIIMVTGDLQHSIKNIDKSVTIMGAGNTPVAVSGGVTLPELDGTVKFVNLSFNGDSTIGLYDDKDTPKTGYKNLNVVIEDCLFTNAGGNCVYIVPEIESLTITGCTFTGKDDLTSGKQYLIWPYQAKTIIITDNEFTGADHIRAPIHLGDGHPDGTTALVSGNTFDNFERGVQIAFTNGSANKVDIDGNEFKDIGIKDWSECQPSEVATVFIHETLKEGTSIDFRNNSLTGGSQRVFYSEHSTISAEDVVNTETFIGNKIGDTILENISDSSFSKWVASVDDVKYATLKEAIQAAMDGENKMVTITSDISVESWDQIWNIVGIEIDGQEHTIEVSAIESLANHDAVFHSAGNNTFKNMTIDMSGISSASTAQGYKGISAAPGDIIENVVFIGGTYGNYGIHVGGTDAEGESITISGCAFTDFDYAIGNQPVSGTSGSLLDSLTVEGCTFKNCDYASILYSPDSEFKDNTVDGGKVNIMHSGQAVTGNDFTGNSRIKFYAEPESFERNSIGLNSYLAYDDDVTDQVDVSDNYWGGSKPTDSQLGGSENTSKASGVEDYYLDEDMTYKSGSENATIEAGDNILTVDGDALIAETEAGLVVTIDVTFGSGATVSFSGTTTSATVIITVKDVTGTSAYIADFLYEVTVEGISASGNYIIGLPFQVPSGEELDSLTVYYYEDSSPQEDMNASWGNGLAVFETPHNSLYGIVMGTVPVMPSPGEDDDPVIVPPVDDDDDYVPLPPVVVDESGSSGDDTVKIVACAAAAVVAALIAAFLIITHRRE